MPMTEPGPPEIPLDLADGAVAIGGRPILRGIDLQVPAGRVRRAAGRQRLRQVHPGPGAHRPAAADGRVAAALRHPARRLRRLAAGRLRAAAHRRRVRRSRLGLGGGRLRTADPPPAAAPAVPRRPGRHRATRSRSSASADKARDGVSQLSGGQQQRALIARALAGEPDLFFLDEPTAGVDLPNQHALADSLRQLKERGATIVLVAHELGPLRAAGRPRRGDARRPGGVRRRAARRPRRCTTPRSPSRTPTITTPAGRPPGRHDHAPARRLSPGADADGPLRLRLHAAGAARRRCSPASPRPPSAPTSSSAGWP